MKRKILGIVVFVILIFTWALCVSGISYMFGGLPNAIEFILGFLGGMVIGYFCADKFLY